MCFPSPVGHLPPGEGHVVQRPLPGRAVAAVTVVADQWWLVVDPTKTDAAVHARVLLEEMAASCVGQ